MFLKRTFMRSIPHIIRRIDIQKLKAFINKKIVRGLFFFLLGVLLFWYVYRDLDLHLIGETLKNLKFEWIFLSFLFGLTSHFIRALRWKMLITPMGHKPRTLNLFLSVLVLYFINLIVPRGGEVARCGTINRFEKIPFVKLVGTVFVERVTDVVTFFIIFTAVIFWKFDLFMKMFHALTFDFSGYQSKVLIIGGVGISVVLLYFGFRRFGILDKFSAKIQQLKKDIKEGISSILLIRAKWLYLIHTALIFLLWLFMLYVIFFAYTPTNNMSFAAAIFAYTIGTLAYLLPIQAGIGVWHFLIIQSLLLFGLEKDAGMMYALIAHTFTNVIYLLFGSVGFVIMPLVNQNRAL